MPDELRVDEKALEAAVDALFDGKREERKARVCEAKTHGEIRAMVKAEAGIAIRAYLAYLTALPAPTAGEAVAWEWGNRLSGSRFLYPERPRGVSEADPWYVRPLYPHPAPTPRSGEASPSKTPAQSVEEARDKARARISFSNDGTTTFMPNEDALDELIAAVRHDTIREVIEMVKRRPRDRAFIPALEALLTHSGDPRGQG